MWEGNAYTDVRIIGDSYFCSHLPLSGLQRGVSPGQTLHTLTSHALYKELILVTYLVCAVSLTDTASNLFMGED